MESNGTSIFVVIFLAVLILSAVLIVWMFVSLVRSELEDERRQMIVGKASTWAFIAVVGGVTVDDEYRDEHDRFHINDANLIMYSHGEYFALGKYLGKFGYSVQKKKKRKK